MHLKNEIEVEKLREYMKELEYNGEIVEIKNEIDEKLGPRIFVDIRQPGCTEDAQVHYLYGENYRKWEKIKRKIYKFRKEAQ